MRVAFDLTIERLAPGAGSARYVGHLAAAVARRDDVELVPVTSPLSEGARGGRIARGLVRELGWYTLGLGRRARREGADLIHCPGPLAPQVAGMPWVITLHDLLPLRHPDLFTRANVLHQRLVLRRAVRRASGVVVSSRHTAREVEELTGVGPDRISVVPLGVDPAFRPVRGDEDELRARLGIPPGPFVLAVGTLEPRKNLLTLLRAFPLVRERVDCRLVVVGGSGWLTAGIEAALGAARGHVVRTGRVSDPDLVRLYSACACFAFPSLDEGFGLPPLEAMACGAAVVAADRSSLPEVVGDAGVLVEPLDVEALADAVAGLVADPARAAALGAAGAARARNFTWDRCAELTVAAYRRALGG